MNHLANNLDFKRAIASQFDPDTDYSNFDEAEIDGAFEATVYQLLLEKVKRSPGIPVPSLGNIVSWDCGAGMNIGKVIKTYPKRTALKFKESTIVCNGTLTDPALQILLFDGSRELKLASQVKIVEYIEEIEVDRGVAPEVDFKELICSSIKEEINNIDFRSIIHSVVKWNGLEIGLEYKPGDIRFKGTGFERKLRCGYGHIRGYIGDDKEALDCYLAPAFFNGVAPSKNIYQISQMSPEDGDFDEYKIMVGFESQEVAQDIYLKEMSPAHFGEIQEITMEELAQYRKPQPSIEPSFSEEKLTQLVANVILSPLNERLDKIINFAQRIQFEGEVLTDDEFDAEASTDEVTIEEAVKDWQEKFPNQANGVIS